MNFNGNRLKVDEYSAEHYRAFLMYLKDAYADDYWHVLPREMAQFWRNR